MKWVFTEQHCCEYSMLWLPRKTSQEALGWAGQTLDLGWVAQLLASRHPVFTEASKGLAAEENGDHTFSHHLLRSFYHKWTPSKEKNGALMNVYQVPVPSLGSKNMNLCWSWRMGGQRHIVCTCWKAARFAFILGWVPHSVGYPRE